MVSKRDPAYIDIPDGCEVVVYDNDTTVTIEEPKRIPLILFSGGLDSSTVLLDALQRSDVDILYVVGRQHPFKVIREGIAIERLVKAMYKYAPYRVRSQYRIDLHHDLHKEAPNYQVAKATQMIDWVYGALEVINPKLHSSLNIGYHYHDDNGFEVAKLMSIWDTLVGIKVYGAAPHDSYGFIGTVPLLTPFYYNPKSHKLPYLPAEVRKHVWVCESPRKVGKGFRACGKCTPCVDFSRVPKPVETELPLLKE